MPEAVDDLEKRIDAFLTECREFRVDMKARNGETVFRLLLDARAALSRAEAEREEAVEMVRSFPFTMKFPHNAPHADEAAARAVADFRAHLVAMMTSDLAPIAEDEPRSCDRGASSSLSRTSGSE